jgi:alpha-tubulin suppressor-like RCC1 family protein
VATDGVLGNQSEHGSRSCGGSAAQACSPSPVPVFGLGDARQVSVGDLTACALVHGGRVVCWGDDGYAQLGTGSVGGPQICAKSEPCSLSPVLVHELSGANSVSVGSANACAVVDHRDALCWGDNSEGALGSGSDVGLEICGSHATACAARPQRAAVPGRVTQISAGDEVACAVNHAGSAYCWGAAASGALGVGSAGVENCVGNGDTGDVPCVRTPTPVAGVGPVSAVAAGYGSSCALGTGGNAYCWGENDTGQLGVGGNGGPRRCPTAAGDLVCANTAQAVKGWQ